MSFVCQRMTSITREFRGIHGCKVQHSMCQDQRMLCAHSIPNNIVPIYGRKFQCTLESTTLHLNNYSSLVPLYCPMPPSRKWKCALRPSFLPHFVYTTLLRCMYSASGIALFHCFFPKSLYNALFEVLPFCKGSHHHILNWSYNLGGGLFKLHTK